MSSRIDSFYELLDRPIHNPTRLALVALVALLIGSYFVPLWQISMEAPQYPKGLSLNIYFDRLEGGHNGHDIDEINELNHYIGMMEIDRSHLVELDWIPFAFGFLGLYALRTAAIGDFRSLIDLSVLIAFVSLFTMGRFVYRLYAFGHFLDPHAAVQIEPFMPVILGTKQVANFTTHSYPRSGSALIVIFALGAFAVTLWQFYRELRGTNRLQTSPGGEGASEAV